MVLVRWARRRYDAWWRHFHAAAAARHAARYHAHRPEDDG